MSNEQKKDEMEKFAGLADKIIDDISKHVYSKLRWRVGGILTGAIAGGLAFWIATGTFPIGSLAVTIGVLMAFIAVLIK